MMMMIKNLIEFYFASIFYTFCTYYFRLIIFLLVVVVVVVVVVAAERILSQHRFTKSQILLR
jgi:hypothetical protein